MLSEILGVANKMIPFVGLLAFIFSILKYFDQRKRELREKRFEQYHKLFNIAAGRTIEGQTVTDVHQAQAIYQLREFPEFKEYSLPILKYWQNKSQGEASLFSEAVNSTHSFLANRSTPHPN
jgi:hypothetical protein